MAGAGVTRGDIGMVLGLAGFLLGGIAFYFGFRTNQRLTEADAALEFDRETIEQLVNDKTQLQRDVQEANKRAAATTVHSDAVEAFELRDALRCGMALADLGRREGIDILGDVALRDASALDDAVTARFFAALKLNEIAGRELVRGDRSLDVKARAAALTAASAAIRTWWATAKDTIRYDAATGRWTND